MSVTIRDVARRAGVAVGTVSRTINGAPNVNPELRARVESVIRELDFRPNARAQNFVRDSSPLISFILGNRGFLHPLHSRILQGVEEYCEEAGYMVLFSKFDYSAQSKPADLRMPRVLRSRGIADCLILAGTHYGCFVEALEKSHTPYVLLANNFISDAPRAPFDQVRVDDIGGAAGAVEYLIRMGHRRIAYIGDTALPWFRVRHQVYLRVLEAHGLEPCAYTLGLSDNAYANGWAGAEMMLAQAPSVTAVFCGVDESAYGVCDLLVSRGVHVPDDISVIGFNDEENAQFKVPPLTTVRVNPTEMGRQLARLAILKLQDSKRQYPEVVLPTSLVKRKSVRPVGDAVSE